jgi:hypothetical protein
MLFRSKTISKAALVNAAMITPNTPNDGISKIIKTIFIAATIT